MRLGMSLTVAGGSEKYAEFLRENIYTQDECATFAAGTSVIVGGEITKVEKKTTKKGSPFANVTIVFELNEWRIKFWKEALQTYEEMLHPGNTVMISGKTDEWNGFNSVVARDVTDNLEDLAKQEA
jgi:DNA polymerase III alpha subunit